MVATVSALETALRDSEGKKKDAVGLQFATLPEGSEELLLCPLKVHVLPFKDIIQREQLVSTNSKCFVRASAVNGLTMGLGRGWFPVLGGCCNPSTLESMCPAFLAEDWSFQLPPTLVALVILGADENTLLCGSMMILMPPACAPWLL